MSLMHTTRSSEAVVDAVAESDGLTVGSIAVLAYMLANILHEGVGHGGACLLSGAKPLALSSVAFECSVDTRLVLAGGTLANLAAGTVFFALGRLTPRGYPRLKYFFWISMTVNILTATGYFLFSGLGGIGDWGEFIQGLGPQWLWRIGLTIFGAVTYLLAAFITMLELRPFIGGNRATRYQRAVRLSAIPYFSGGILMCIAGSLNPRGMILILISAAASTFGGTSALMWITALMSVMDRLNGGTRIPGGLPSEPIAIPRSWFLIAAACAIAFAFVAVLGPGISLAVPTHKAVMIWPAAAPVDSPR